MSIKIFILLALALSAHTQMSGRPAPQDRNFTSTIIEKVIEDLSAQIQDPKLRQTFSNCFPNTLDTTTLHFEYNKHTQKYETFIITGDIPAEWTRDSTNQVLPYVQFADQDQHLKNMLIGVINRQVKHILIDPYSNAYNYQNQSQSSTFSDYTTRLVNGKLEQVRDGRIWERKYELDSLAAFLKMSNEYYFQTKDDSFIDKEWVQALELTVETLVRQSYGTFDELEKFNQFDYTFTRNDGNSIDTLVNRAGNPTASCGLIKSAFRPSDDASVLNYLIPANAMVSVELNRTSKLLQEFKQKQIQNIGSNVRRTQFAYNFNLNELIHKTHKLGDQIKKAIYEHAVITHRYTKKQVFAYEIDCFGNHYFMDDANIPSLLSLPYLGFIDKNDPLYLNTREAVLSKYNPYFFKGKAGEGTGGPHVGYNYIWPMSIMIRALTTDNDEEILQCLQTLRDTTDGTQFMHESFFQDDASKYTRHWFAWANSLFGELIITIANQKPYLLKFDFDQKIDIKQIQM